MKEGDAQTGRGCCNYNFTFLFRSQFLKLPAQALPSKLAYIQPFEGVRSLLTEMCHCSRKIKGITSQGLL